MTAYHSRIDGFTETVPDRYRFARPKRTARNVGNRVSGFVKGIIDAIVEAKIRRLNRELQFYGVRYRSFDSSGN